LLAALCEKNGEYMSVLKIIFLSIFVLLAGCVTKDNFVKKQEASFQNGVASMGIKSYGVSGGITCCYEVFTEIKDASSQKPILVLTRQPEPGTRKQRLSIPAGSADELIEYLDYQYNLPEGETDQKGIRLGGGTWRVGSNIHEGKRIVFLIDLNYSFAFDNKDLPELIKLLKSYRQNFIELNT
jgi:hypothetical protein